MDVDRAVVVAMAEGARWAPSVHNSQPWRFRSRRDGIDVVLAPDRSLPVLDPDGRLRALSCGTAAAAAAAVSTALGCGTRTALLPEGPRSEVVARVVCVTARRPTAADRRLADAVPRRRTHPVLHPDEKVDAAGLDELSLTVEDDGVALRVLDGEGRRVLLGLLGDALEEHRRRPVLVEETRRWLRAPARTARPVDGVLRGSLSPWPYPVGTLVREDPDALEALLSAGAPSATPGPAAPATPSAPPARSGLSAADGMHDGTAVLLWTSTDSRRDQVRAGVALERLLLHATALDLVASFCDLATQLPATRARLAALLPRRGHVQVALRLGRQLVDVRTPPRRPLADVLDVSPSGPPVVDLTDRALGAPS